MTDAPFGGFDFRVEIRLPGRDAPLCDARFAECDGLEIRLDVQQVREGGDPRRVRLVPGGFSAGEVTLRRGMTSSLDLWDWVAAVADDPALRADAAVSVLDPQGAPRVAFLLARCLPVRLRGPRLHAMESAVAVEELVLAAEAMEVIRTGRKVRRAALTKATFAPVGGGTRFAVPMNPSQLRRERGADGDRLHMVLHLDASGGDARELTQPLDELLAAGGVRFAWGSFRFVGRLTSVTEDYGGFAADGRPATATVTLELTAS